jgi:hypothetical protein
MTKGLHAAARPVGSAALSLIVVMTAAACGGGSPTPAPATASTATHSESSTATPSASSTATPSAASTTQGSSPVNATPGNGGLAAKVVPAPPGFAPYNMPNGPVSLSAADFNQFMGAGSAARFHFIRGYTAIYNSNTNSDSITVILFQLATPADVAAFKATGFAFGGQVSLRADPAIPDGLEFDSTSPSQGTYTHAEIATKGNVAFLIIDTTRSAAPVPLVERMARQQYAAL